MASPKTLQLRRSLPRPTITVWHGHAKNPRLISGTATPGLHTPINKPFKMGNTTYICDQQGTIRRHE